MALFPESEELQTPIKTHISSLEHHIIRITYEHLSHHTKRPQNVHINKIKNNIFGQTTVAQFFFVYDAKKQNVCLDRVEQLKWRKGM